MRGLHAAADAAVDIDIVMAGIASADIIAVHAAAHGRVADNDRVAGGVSCFTLAAIHVAGHVAVLQNNGIAAREAADGESAIDMAAHAAVPHENRVAAHVAALRHARGQVTGKHAVGNRDAVVLGARAIAYACGGPFCRNAGGGNDHRVAIGLTDARLCRGQDPGVHCRSPHHHCVAAGRGALIAFRTAEVGVNGATLHKKAVAVCPALGMHEVEQRHRNLHVIEPARIFRAACERPNHIEGTDRGDEGKFSAKHTRIAGSIFRDQAAGISVRIPLGIYVAVTQLESAVRYCIRPDAVHGPLRGNNVRILYGHRAAAGRARSLHLNTSRIHPRRNTRHAGG